MTAPAPVRFWAKVAGGDFAECWTWQAARDGGGYGMFHVATGRVTRAHQWSYAQMVGEVDDGLQLDHLCRNRACVNPWHLDPVTPLVNIRRSPVHNGTKSHCPQGHPYDETNTYLHKGRRDCRACHATRARERSERRAAA